MDTPIVAANERAVMIQRVGVTSSSEKASAEAKRQGPVNAASHPAFHSLRAEGLRPNGMYDPVDGGPTITRQLGQTSSARTRIVGTATLIDDAGSGAGSEAVDALVSSVNIGEFAATRARVVLRGDGEVGLTSAIGARLGVEPGALVSAVPLGAGRTP